MPEYQNLTGGPIEMPGDGEHEAVTIEPGETVTADQNPAPALFKDPADPDDDRTVYQDTPEPEPEPPPEPVAAQPEEVTNADS